MGSTITSLNVFICGNVNNEYNRRIIKELFPIIDKPVKFDDTYLIFEKRKREEKIKEIKFDMNWNCFILTQRLNSSLSEKLLKHIKNFSEKEKQFNNVILYFSDQNYNILIQRFQEEKINNQIYEENLSFIIVFNNNIRDDTNKLNYLNYLPSSNSRLRDINIIRNKLISIDAYYNERGSLYKEFLKNELPSLTLKIILIGKLGSGKSTFINKSFGELVSKTSSDFKAVTSKCTEYLLPYVLEERRKGRIMLIDTPGFEDDKSVKRVKELIENYIQKANDSKDVIHCALYFLNDGDRQQNIETNIFDFLNDQKIETFFIINRSHVQNSVTKSRIIHFFQNENNIGNRVINVNLVQEELINSNNNSINEPHRYLPIFGINEVYRAIYDYLTPDIYNDELFISLRNAKKIDDKLKILKEISIFFKQFNSIEDIKEGAHTYAKLIVTGFSIASCGAGFTPIPLLDIPIVIGIQIGMILSLSALYGLSGKDYSLKDILLSDGSIGDNVIKTIGSTFMEGVKIGIKSTIEGFSKETEKIVFKYVLKESAKLFSKASVSEFIKSAPILGTIIGSTVSGGIFAAYTILLGAKTIK